MKDIIVDKPIKRSKLRLKLGKEYFILKRKFEWWRHRHAYSTIDINNNTCCYSHKKHQSFLLRPLKDVDMYLQYNKITNLRLAIEKLNGSIIKPNQHFSIWQKVGRPSKKRGFLEGLSLHNGQIGKDIGGGLLANIPLTHHYEILETDHRIEQQWWGGYTRHNKIWQRQTHLIDNHVEEKLISENHAIMMCTPFIASNES